MRTILVQLDDLGETFTFSERDFSSQAPGPFNERTASNFAVTTQTSSIEGAKQMLGQIFNNPNINSL